MTVGIFSLLTISRYSGCQLWNSERSEMITRHIAAQIRRWPSRCNTRDIRRYRGIGNVHFPCHVPVLTQTATYCQAVNELCCCIHHELREEPGQPWKGWMINTSLVSYPQTPPQASASRLDVCLPQYVVRESKIPRQLESSHRKIFDTRGSFGPDLLTGRAEICGLFLPMGSRL